jgi:hypothetical protein
MSSTVFGVAQCRGSQSTSEATVDDLSKQLECFSLVCELDGLPVARGVNCGPSNPTRLHVLPLQDRHWRVAWRDPPVGSASESGPPSQAGHPIGLQITGWSKVGRTQRRKGARVPDSASSGRSSRVNGVIVSAGR